MQLLREASGEKSATLLKFQGFVFYVSLFVSFFLSFCIYLFIYLFQLSFFLSVYLSDFYSRSQQPGGLDPASHTNIALLGR